ncbi:MAG: TIGR03557 family F420-dependent LLM class oxidoreductase, partial [Actinomycetota bacterium]
GTGERLNEHVVGRGWPPARIRTEMLEEAVGIIRALFRGETLDHRGRYFSVESARLYTLSEAPPPIYLAGGSRRSAAAAGRLGDGFIGDAPDTRHVEAFEAAGGVGKPRLGKVTVCWAPTEEQARRTAHSRWPNGALPASLLTELALPRHFEQAARLVSEDKVARAITCGPDPARHLEAIARFAAAGFDEVYVHQVGPDQEGFFRFYEAEILPCLGQTGRACGSAKRS